MADEKQNMRKEVNISFLGIPPVTRLLPPRPSVLKVHHIPPKPAGDHAGLGRPDDESLSRQELTANTQVK